MNATGGIARAAVRVAAVTMIASLAACRPLPTDNSSSPGRPVPSSGAAAAATRPTRPVGFSFDTPEGFVPDSGYEILVPLYRSRVSQWRRPADDRGLDVIAVNSYLMDDDVTEASDDALVGRVEGYARKVGARAVSPPERTRDPVAGRTAWQQTVEQPGPAGTYRYLATYVFDGWFVVQVMCQYAGRAEQIATACRKVLDTLRLHEP